MMVRAPRFPTSISYPHKPKSLPARVKTRGVPDMREPSSPSPLAMKEKQFGEYQSPFFISKTEQSTVFDKIRNQGTIFDEIQRRSDPERKLADGIPMSYQEPGALKVKRPTQHRIMSRGTLFRTGALEEATKGITKDIKVGESYAKEISPKLEETVVVAGKSGKPEKIRVPTKLGLKVEHAKRFAKQDKFLMAEQEAEEAKFRGAKEYLSSKKHQASSSIQTGIQDIKESTPYIKGIEKSSVRRKQLAQQRQASQLEEVLAESDAIDIPPSPPPKQTPEDYRYPYNKQIIEDIKRQESGKAKFKRKR